MVIAEEATFRLRISLPRRRSLSRETGALGVLVHGECDRHLIVTELFASANDKTPATSELPADGSAGELLQNIATAAMRLPCVTR
jgi:hypothetical protein